MREENRAERQRQIEQAAYRVLEKKGYAGASMLAIAKQARASNETLYNWYGDKQGLFKALVAGNAAEVKGLLQAERQSESDPIETLKLLGPKLLALLAGERAVALNRAAAADPSGELGAAISQAGRESVLPMIEEVLNHARTRGQLAFGSTGEAAALYIALLVGDLQIRRAIGRVPAPSEQWCKQRGILAVQRLTQLLTIS